MQRIGVRELRQNASVYLNRVKAGETVEVTERGVLVALLTPPSAAQTTRERMIAEGQLVPARAARRLPTRRSPRPGSSSGQQILDDQRAERL